MFVCWGWGKFVPPNIHIFVQFRDFEELYLHQCSPNHFQTDSVSCHLLLRITRMDMAQGVGGRGTSRVKITCYLHMWKYHHCYGFIINHTFQTKNYWSKMVWNFIGVYIINRTLHGCLEIWNFSSRVEKNISLVHCAHSWNIFQHLKRNFISPGGHVISSIGQCFLMKFVWYLLGIISCTGDSTK